MTHKTKEEARANLEAAVAYIPARYVSGVNKADWLNPAKSPQAEANYAAGVQSAVSKKTRQKAIGKMSNEDWRKAAAEKGGAVIGTRLAANLDKWLTNWGGLYDQVISVVGALPPKTTDFMANINNRLVPTVKAWKKAAGKS